VAEIKKAHPAAEATLTPGSGGIFDVVIDGKTVFSKHQTGRFPTAQEVLGAIAGK
jgi:selT/selW/selH-like putative selenoprotein